MKPGNTIMTFAIILVLIAMFFYLLMKKGDADFKKDVKALFAASEVVPDKYFTYEQLAGLPEPVQRYFKYAMKEGQPYISYVRLQHNGQFKTAPEKDWIDIKGHQYFTLASPGFIWKGMTTLFTADDRYVNGQGRLTVKLLSLFKIVDGKGPQFDEGELQRWLAENFWFPTNLLPNEHMRWESVDEATARLIFEYKEMSLTMNVSFNEKGELITIACQRYMGEDNLQKWQGYASEYEERNGIMIPTFIEAVWALDSGDYSYARFKIKTIEYDYPVPFLNN
jgi:hypothetical protein